MTLSTIRIVTRESPLAMWQANYVKQALHAAHADLAVKILGITTEADRLLGASLESLGGKGAFVKELEQALLNGAADIAVHSMKDVTIDLPKTLAVPVIMAREDPRDVLISNHYSSFSELPPAARVGTSSLRRKSQLLAQRPDLEIVEVRGNVGTRLRKLDDGEFDALVLAAAGIKRLGLVERVSHYFPIQSLLPAVSQGALGIEMQVENLAVLKLIAPLGDECTQRCVTAERALNRRLGGDCHVPIAAHAQIIGSMLHIRGLVAALDGSELIQAQNSGRAGEAESLGNRLGEKLLDLGAARILRQSSLNDAR